MKKRILSLLMIVSLLIVTVLACPGEAGALSKKYSNRDFLDESGIVRSRKFEHIQSYYKNLRDIGETGGHYVVVGTVKIDENLTVNGEVFLLLANDSKLIINAGAGKAGIKVAAGNKLHIFQQKTSKGQKLGELEVSGGKSSAGIGSESGEKPGHIEINGGKITATGGLDAAGIGSGYGKHEGGTVIIRGGETEASCWLNSSKNPNSSGAAIGGGCYGDGGIITISGGKVTAKSFSGAAIGGGREGAGGTITITGGDIAAECVSTGSALGGGDSGNSGNITISGGDVKAESRYEAAIGAGKNGYCRTINITGGKTSAISAITGNGIGGSKTGIGGTVSISGGIVIVGAGTYNKYEQIRDIGVGEDNKLDLLEVSGDAVLLLKNNRYNDPIATTSHVFKTASSSSDYEKYNLPLSPADESSLDQWCSSGHKLGIWSPAAPGTKIVTAVSIASKPDKFDYFTGEELDLTGGQLFVKTIHNEKNFKVSMTDPRVSSSGFNSNSKVYGLQTVTVKLGEETSSFEVYINRFKDVTRGKWYYDYVENLAARRIINGYPSGDFRPNNSAQRQHVCLMVVKAAGLSSQGKIADFPDVPRNSEASPFIAALQEKGAIGGYPDGTFKPKRSVSRAEIAKIIAESFDIKSADTIGGLNDIVGHWGEVSIRRLASNGIIKGYPDGNYRPNAPVSRAELAKMITVAMAVNAVQKAEENPNPGTFAPAQELIDAIPDQDLLTRQKLQARLDVHKGESK